MIDGPQSVVWQQSANRLPTEEALLLLLTRGAEPMTRRRAIVVALGGNALLRRGEPAEAETQRRNVLEAASALAALAATHELVITHGNGPQVGLLALEAEAYKAVAPYPLDVLGAESQGMIGYLLVQALRNELPAARRRRAADAGASSTPTTPRSSQPTKPIGPVYSEREARQLAREHGWSVARDGNYFRVSSPRRSRKQIVELHAIERSLDAGASSSAPAAAASRSLPTRTVCAASKP